MTMTCAFDHAESLQQSDIQEADFSTGESESNSCDVVFWFPGKPVEPQNISSPAYTVDNITPAKAEEKSFRNEGCMKEIYLQLEVNLHSRCEGEKFAECRKEVLRLEMKLKDREIQATRGEQERAEVSKIQAQEISKLKEGFIRLEGETADMRKLSRKITGSAPEGHLKG
ncbi:hypothetical protein R1flu_017205 [Riccia fluitans]|uniref:Uncharacterized protein n=1 Tax=Riccia fluitans TaxID=41844 RepID=A0ABD1XEP3_9MARC